ncbi:thioredoxin H9-like isoform X1 [Pyrus x bretschneideri]|nr:thioredoxin H9-like isoform X1 [Pyrus x bretschneideri]
MRLGSYHNFQQFDHILKAFQVCSVTSLVLDIKMGSCASKGKTEEDDYEDKIEFTGANVHLITTTEAWDQKMEEAKKDGKVVIANFSATWCGPCKIIAPLYRELSEQYTSLMFLVVDVDELTDFSTSWDIKATPTFFFLRDGQQIDKLVGANKPELQKKIVSVVESIETCEK